MRTSTMAAFVGGAVTALVLTAGAVAAAVPAPAVSTAAEPSGPYDGTTPSLSLQPPRFVLGTSIDASFCYPLHVAIPMELRWTASDTGSGLAGFDVYVVKSYDEPQTIPLPVDARSYRFNAGDYDSSCGDASLDNVYQVIAKDNFGGSATSARAHQHVDVYQEDGTNLAAPEFPGTSMTTARSGVWSTSTCLCFDGHTTAYTTQAGASVTVTVTGARRLALVMPKNANRGQASISVDGASPTVVDTYAASAQNRVLVWQVELPSTAAHKVVVTNKATPGRSRIDLDAVVVQ